MKYLISYSGGKDSTTTLLWAYENLPIQDIAVVFCDTGWETKLTYEYIDYIENWCKSKGIEFFKIIPPMRFEDLVYHKKMFPRHTRRYCTELLKIKPFFMFLQQFKEKYKECIILVGERAEESITRAKKTVMDFNRYYQNVVIRPIFNWSVEQVFEIHKKHELKYNPMYDMGFTRVGCAPCIFANKNDIRLLIKYFPEQIKKVREMEKKLNKLREEKGLQGYPNTFFQINKLGKGIIADIDTIISWATGNTEVTIDDLLEQAGEYRCKASYAVLCE